ncbi:hypothetical protein DFH09DRAFT_1067682 [Mycena vulgaris]|nr:hypothetical protein DFH09DRAFT_1067682 [Mycena vulgaris]
MHWLGSRSNSSSPSFANCLPEPLVMNDLSPQYLSLYIHVVSSHPCKLGTVRVVLLSNYTGPTGLLFLASYVFNKLGTFRSLVSSNLGTLFIPFASIDLANALYSLQLHGFYAVPRFKVSSKFQFNSSRGAHTKPEPPFMRSPSALYAARIESHRLNATLNVLNAALPRTHSDASLLILELLYPASVKKAFASQVPTRDSDSDRRWIWVLDLAVRSLCLDFLGMYLPNLRRGLDSRWMEHPERLAWYATSCNRAGGSLNTAHTASRLLRPSRATAARFKRLAPSDSILILHAHLLVAELGLCARADEAAAVPRCTHKVPAGRDSFKRGTIDSLVIRHLRVQTDKAGASSRDSAPHKFAASRPGDATRAKLGPSRRRPPRSPRFDRAAAKSPHGTRVVRSPVSAATKPCQRATGRCAVLAAPAPESWEVHGGERHWRAMAGKCSRPRCDSGDDRGGPCGVLLHNVGQVGGASRKERKSVRTEEWIHFGMCSLLTTLHGVGCVRRATRGERDVRTRAVGIGPDSGNVLVRVRLEADWWTLQGSARATPRVERNRRKTGEGQTRRVQYAVGWGVPRTASWRRLMRCEEAACGRVWQGGRAQRSERAMTTRALVVGECPRDIGAGSRRCRAKRQMSADAAGAEPSTHVGDTRRPASTPSCLGDGGFPCVMPIAAQIWASEDAPHAPKQFCTTFHSYTPSPLDFNSMGAANTSPMLLAGGFPMLEILHRTPHLETLSAHLRKPPLESQLAAVQLDHLHTIESWGSWQPNLDILEHITVPGLKHLIIGVSAPSLPKILVITKSNEKFGYTGT